MLQGEHFAILSTFIKLPFVFKIFVLSIFEWPLKTGFTVIPCVIFQACLEKALESDENEVEMRNRQNQELKLKSPTIKTLELLLQVLDYMYRHDLKFVEDYRY